MSTWFTGLGTGMKVVVGIAAAAVVGVVGVSAASAIDGIVSEEMPVPTETETLEPTSEPTKSVYSEDEYDSFGEWVSERAHDKQGTGREFGKEISDAAHEKSGNHTESGDVSEPEDDADVEVESETGHGKPDKPGKPSKP